MGGRVKNHCPQAQFYKIPRTYPTMNDAFKDADYATAIWRCESDTQRAWRLVNKYFMPVFAIAMLAITIWSFTTPVFSMITFITSKLN
jgi:hypothetical protein